MGICLPVSANETSLQTLCVATFSFRHNLQNYKIRSSTIFCRSKSNVNFQIVDVKVLQEEIKPMITKTLLILKAWPRDSNLKYAMVDFDKKEELSALENVFPETFLVLRHFYREQSWIIWMSKANHGISIYADEVKCRLCRIANSLNEE